MIENYIENLKDLTPYLICPAESIKYLDINIPELKTWGGDKLKCIDPLKTNSEQWIQKIKRLDSLSFGPSGMPMPDWVLLDCAMMPSGIFGFCIKGDQLSSRDKNLLKINENEFFPISMYIAIPTLDNSVWFGHNLSSLNNHLENNLKGLGIVTKFMALRMFQVQKLRGATQWKSNAIHLHMKLNKLQILSAWTTAHTHHETLCYETISTDEYQSFANETYKIQKEDLLELQKKIESGQRFVLDSIQSDIISVSKIKVLK